MNDERSPLFAGIPTIFSIMYALMGVFAIVRNFHVAWIIWIVLWAIISTVMIHITIMEKRGM